MKYIDRPYSTMKYIFTSLSPSKINASNIVSITRGSKCLQKNPESTFESIFL